MKAQLTNIKMFPSSQGYGLKATLILDGTKAAHVYDKGDGGAMTFDVVDKEKFNTLKTAIAELPPVFVPSWGMEMKLSEGLFICLLHEAQVTKTDFNLLNN